MALLLITAPANADGPKHFEQAVAEVAQTWRGAAHELRNGRPRVAAIDLAEAKEAWATVAARSTGRSGDGSKGPGIAPASIARVGDLLGAAREAAQAGDAETGLASLDAILIELAPLRDRDQVGTFALCVGQMNEAIERLVRLRHDRPDLLQPAVVDRIERQVALAEHLYRRCPEAAPDVLRREAGFDTLFDGVLDALPGLREAAAAPDDHRFLDLLRKVEGFNQQIFLKFG
ncbi:MAG: hypothetical protein R3349_11060 [Geminicoccaceae bacterium]|nr:hypothetical protein [Geminicoccaceae bacterium]